MRTYGRITNEDGSKTWVEVQTDSQTGSDSWVWVTALCQALLLNLNESPFYAQYGIPAEQSILQQIQPDYYVSRTQQQFAQRFASLIVAKDVQQQVYKINAILLEGSPASVTIKIPE